MNAETPGGIESLLARRPLTVKEFAVCLNISPASVYKMIASGQVAVIDNPTGGVRIPREEVQDYLKRNKKRVKAEEPAPERPPARAKRMPAPADEPVTSDGKVHLRLR